MKINEFLELTGAQTVNLADSDAEITGCHIGDLLSLVMSRASDGDAWITVQINVNVAAVSVLVDMACVVVAEGMQPDAELIKKAEQQGINLFKSEKSAYELAKIIAEAGI